jgi:hypothetical protein
MSIFELLGSKRIQKIDAVAFPGLIDSRENIIRNGDFSSGDFAGWYNSLGGCSINRDPAKVWLGKYSAKLPGISGVYVLQDLPPLYGDELAFIFRAISDNGNPHLFYKIVFSDGTYESGDFATLSSNWTIGVWEPTTHKAVAFIYIGNQTVGNNSVFLASVAGIRKNKLAADGTITHFSKNATGDHLTPAAGKALKVWGFFYYADADIKTEIRFKTSGNVIGALASKGSCGMNLLTMTKPQGAADEKIEIYLSGAGNAKGWTCTSEV